MIMMNKNNGDIFRKVFDNKIRIIEKFKEL